MRITSIREVFTLLGILTAAAIPAIVAGYGYSERTSLGLIAWGAIGVGLILFPVLLFSVPENRNPETTTLTLNTVLTAVTHNKPFRLLIAGWFLNSLANGIPAVLFILFMKHVLGASDAERGVLTFIYFLAGIIGMPLWLILSRQVGKHRAWSVAMIGACLAFAFVPAMGQGDVYVFGIVCLMTGLALGADLALPPAIQADVVEYELFRSGHNVSGSLFAIWSMATKIAFALSVVIAFPLLEALGFAPDLLRTENNLLALSLIYAGAPVVLKLGAVVLVWNYPLTERKQKILRRRLASRSTIGDASANET